MKGFEWVEKAIQQKSSIPRPPIIFGNDIATMLSQVARKELFTPGIVGFTSPLNSPAALLQEKMKHSILGMTSFDEITKAIKIKDNFALSSVGNLHALVSRNRSLLDKLTGITRQFKLPYDMANEVVKSMSKGVLSVDQVTAWQKQLPKIKYGALPYSRNLNKIADTLLATKTIDLHDVETINYAVNDLEARLDEYIEGTYTADKPLDRATVHFLLGIFITILFFIWTQYDAIQQEERSVARDKEMKDAIKAIEIKAGEAVETTIRIEEKLESIIPYFAMEDVKLREEQNKESTAIATVKKGQEVHVMESNGEWIRINYADPMISKNMFGWVMGEFFETIEAK